ncbi:GNAT family N-acetyltransferase [Bradyrhizobium sp.]|uniref:GNAT family N-acetyltransferase n=1 Tax=Bradyrhizobium sp. TaxID=376 RepID=UPI002635E017|nr:GNAT family N-acetyltransferase [Bradyrhizobium sp.]
MTVIHLVEHPRHTDHLRLRDGKTLTVRLVAPDDAETLQGYFRRLSTGSRYSRFLGAMSELPANELDHFIHAGENDRFSVIAAMMIDGHETTVGEARYGFEAATGNFEFGISIDDRWQGKGIGSALLRNLECRAAALGAHLMFGDTLRSNEAMIALARKSGYAFTRHPDDWKLARFEKPIDPIHQDIPCASWRLAREQHALEAMA